MPSKRAQSKNLLNFNNEQFYDFLSRAQRILGVGFWYWDRKSGLFTFSQPLLERIGYDKFDSTPGLKRILKLIHPDDRDSVEAAFNRLINDKAKEREIEFRILSRNNNYRWLRCKAAVAMRDDNGLVSLIIGKVSDIDAHVTTRNELEKSEYRLRKAQEIGHIGSFEYNLADAKSYWSDETYRILGFPLKEEFTDLETIAPYLEPRAIDYLKSKIEEVRNSKQKRTFSVEFRYYGPDKVEKHLKVIAECVRDANRKIVKWQGVLQDITSLKVNERALKDDKENLMALVRNMPALVFATNRNGEIVFWNRECDRVTGYKSSEIVRNKDAFRILYPNGKERQAFKQLLKTKGDAQSSWEFQITTKKGETRDIVWSAFTEFVRIEGWENVFIGYNFTSRKKAELIQKAYSKKLEALAGTAIDFVGLPLEESIFHYVGKQLEKLVPGPIYIMCSLEPDHLVITVEGIFGMPQKELHKAVELLTWNPVGRRYQVTEKTFDYYRKGKIELIEKDLYELADGNLSLTLSRTIERTYNLGQKLAVGMVYSGRPMGGVLILTGDKSMDIDYSLIEGLVNQASVALYRRELENQLVAAKVKAVEADRLKSAFLANMSHEIRTPMNAILGFSQLLAIPDLPDVKRKQYIDIINSKGNMLVKLINDIIDASKVEAGQLTIIKVPFTLNNLLNNINKFYQKEKILQQREAVEISLEMPPDTDSLEINTDEGRLEQVLTNLIGNALKFTERGFVKFGYTVETDCILFFVKDTGIGIDPKMQQYIFERFRQVDDGASKKYGGTGLGLAISRGIVQLMGGKIWVESIPGEGTTFFFTIPYRQKTKRVPLPEVRSAEEEQEHYPDWKNKVILVAEDEEVNYVFINELLSPTGATVIWAQDGRQAVELVATLKKIDIILMDIKMPVMNGYAATMEIHQINPSIPIIAQTAYAFSEDRQKAEAAGCNDYITKPINSQELFAIMESYIGA